MGFHFDFHLAEDRKDIDGLEGFVRQQPFDYPNYDDWVSKMKAEVLAGYKTAILAFSEGVLVGNLIYQKHKTLGKVRELKNLRIHPKLQRRDFAHFMIRQAESYKPEEFNAVFADTHSDNFPIISLLRFMGYEEIARATLYDSNQEEAIYMKKFERTPAGILIPLKNFISFQSI